MAQEPKTNLTELQGLIAGSQKDAASQQLAVAEQEARQKLEPATAGCAAALEPLAKSLARMKLQGPCQVSTRQRNPSGLGGLPWSPTGATLFDSPPGEEVIGTCWLCENGIKAQEKHSVNYLHRRQHTACVRALEDKRRADAKTGKGKQRYT